MSADILSDPTYPHGTIEGFSKCRGAHCPAPMSCRDVFLRYQGDYGFRKALDGGETGAQVVERERKAAEDTKLAARGVRAYRRPEVTKAGTPRAPRVPGAPITQRQFRVIELHQRGLTDRQIAAELGKTRDQVCATRKGLRLKANVGPSGDDRIRAAHAKGLSDNLIAAEVNLTIDHVRSRRRRMGLPIVPQNATVLATTDLVRLHAQGLTDRQIGETLRVDPTYVARRRRKLHLTPNQAPAMSGASSS